MSPFGTRLLTIAAVSATLATGSTPALAEPTPGDSQSMATRTAHAEPHAKGPMARWVADLSDPQRACLADHGITRPTAPLSDLERQARRAKVKEAAKACDLTLPGAARRAELVTAWKALSGEQRTCLKDQGLTRPWGPLTPPARTEFLAKLSAAARTCGVNLPTGS